MDDVSALLYAIIKFLEVFKMFLKNLLAFNFSIKCFSKSLLLIIIVIVILITIINAE